MIWFSPTFTQLQSNERKRLFGRKKAGVPVPLSSTFEHCYTPVSERGLAQDARAQRDEEDSNSRYRMVVSEGNDGEVREIEVCVRVCVCVRAWVCLAERVGR